jgi:hypothetical protein
MTTDKKEFFDDESIIYQEAVNVTTNKNQTVGISIIIGNKEVVLELEQLRLAVNHLESMINE